MPGATPRNDTEGVLQDVHWSHGSFGYFPTYAIGTIYYAKIAAAMRKDIKNMDRLIATLQFKPILAWLRKNIHQYNNILPADEIIRKATGSGLDPQPFVDYLKKKYEKIYGL